MIREKIDDLYHDFYKTQGKTPKILVIHSNSFIEFKRECKLSETKWGTYYKEMKIITTFDIETDEFILA